MKLLNFSVLLAIIFSLFSFSVLAEPADTGATCTKITDTKGNLGLSIGKVSGLCAEFFDSPQKMTFFVILPAVLFGIVIWGVLEEIGLFAAKPGIHIALAILLSMMLLPTGAFGQVALVIYSGGAMATVLAVGGLFILGLTFWVRKKAHSFGYAGVFSGWVGWTITAVGVGFVGYFVGQTLGQAWTGAIIGAVLGVVWSVFGGKGKLMTAGAISHKMDTIQSRIRTIDIDVAKQTAKQNATVDPALKAMITSRIAALQKERDILDSEMKDLEKKHQTAMLDSV